MNHWFATSGHAAVLRGSIENVLHRSIDVSLKDLRNVSRRATAFSMPYRNELQLLERIYYKGKNQHRSALFWRKVLEMRRLGIRINEMKFSAFVEDLRYAFYGTVDRSNPKVFRGAWKQVPDSSSCVHLLTMLRSQCLLVDQARSRFRSAHEAFTQQIRTTTFIPLAMSLISIASRLDFLVSELREMLVSLWQAVARILDTIAEPGINNHHNVKFPLDPWCLTAAIPSSGPGATKIERAHKRARITADLTEDCGSKISRDSHPIPTALQIPVPSGTEGWTLSFSELELSTIHSGVSIVTPTLHHDISVASSSTRSMVPSQVLDVTTISAQAKSMLLTETHPIQSPHGELEERNPKQGLAENRSKVKRVKRDKRDEIDHIFGF